MGQALALQTGTGSMDECRLLPLPYGGYACVPKRLTTPPKGTRLQPVGRRWLQSHLNDSGRHRRRRYRRPHSPALSAALSDPAPPDVDLALRGATDGACALRVVHVSDVYELGALPKLRSFIARHRAAAEHSGAGFIACFGGDWVSPYPLAQLDKGKGMTECLRMAGLTHTCIGNHEADIAPAELAERLTEWASGGGVVLNSNLPLLDAVLGVRTSRSAEIAVRSPDRSQQRTVSLVGAVTVEPSLYTDGYDFGGAMKGAPEPNDCVAACLRESRADLVVPLTHQGIAADRELARAHGVDATGGRLLCVLGGHDHDRVAETHSGCFVAKPGQDAASATVVDVVWDAPGAAARVTRAELRPVQDWGECVKLRANVERHLAQLEVFQHVQLLPRALCPEGLCSQGIRRQQTTMGSMLCDSIKLIAGADACFLEAGCVRAQRAYTDGVSVADLRAELPWDTEMAIVEMRGRHVALAVEGSRLQYPRENAGWLQHDSGVAVAVTTDGCDEGGACFSVTAVSGEPLDPDRMYTVAAIYASVVKGMDGNPGFRAWREEEAACGRELPDVSDCPPAKQFVRVAWAKAVWDNLPPFTELSRGGTHIGEKQLLAAWGRAFPPASLPEAQAAEFSVRRLLEASDLDRDGAVSWGDYCATRAAFDGDYPLEHLFALHDRSPMG